MRSWCVFLVSCTMFAQVSVREASTTTHLDAGRTMVSLAVTNSSGSPVQAVLRLEWMNPEGMPDTKVRRTVQLNPGGSNIEIPLPLHPAGDLLVERLYYQVSPGEQNYNAFRPQQGILSLPDIAGYAFTLSVVTTDFPRRGRLYPIHVFAAHAITHKAVSGVEVRSGTVAAMTDRDGMAVLRIPISEGPGGNNTVTVEGKLGDYMQSRDVSMLPKPDVVNIYTDKPLYQPGQTIHIRFLALSSAGPVEANVEHEIRILDENEDVMFATKATTSRFGIASADWTVPPNAKSGHYTIDVQRDGLDGFFTYEVEIRRYELPSFRVSAKPTRAYYLTEQKADIDIAAEYLFGKPVEKGAVRVSSEDSDKTIASGSLEAGHFRAIVETGNVPEGIEFSDRHLIAYVTDASTNRTEQRKLDLRVSRFALNLYVAKQEQTEHEEIFYVSTYLPDGEPARAAVKVIADGKTVGEGKANRYGLTRISFPRGDYHSIAVRGTTVNGSAEEPVFVRGNISSSIWLETDRVLYRTDERVRCHITGAAKNAPVLLLAWDADGHTLFSKDLALSNGQADIEIPYEPRFGNQLSIGVVSPALDGSAARAVLFPGKPAFSVRATPSRAIYRPGDTATIRFESSNPAALGVAIVDQSVFERAQSDAMPQRWFSAADEPQLAGIRARDLQSLDPAKINDDLQLVAAVLVPTPAFASEGDELQADTQNAFRLSIDRSLAGIETALDRHYADTLQFPRNEEELESALGAEYTATHDPWMRPWYSEFAIKGPEYVLRIISSGPDKKRGTADDFTGLEVRRKWFTPYEALITQQLRGLSDYPATAGEFKALVHKAGIDFDVLRDPWGSELRIRIDYEQQNRIIRVLSAGPDRKWNTADDFAASEFSGYYFRSANRRIGQIISGWPTFPQNEAEVRTLLQRGGFDFDSLRDPWGRPYSIAFSTQDYWSDGVEVYSYAEYKHPVEERKQIKPVKLHVLVLQIRSAGKDGVPGTYDDFSVAEFRRPVENHAANPALPELKQLPPGHVAGTGTIHGQVCDQSGAAIPNTHVVLNAVYETHTDENGEYDFFAVPPGTYELRMEMRGFQRYDLIDVPVQADRITQANVVLQIGSVMQTVEVAGAKQNAISTPHVREYFPETLFWAPEIITGKDGTVSVQVKLADSVTTWHVAAIASTVDGKITETDTLFKAFQPFLIDLDLPPVLTAGDAISLPVPIRNYTREPEHVKLSAELPPALKWGQGAFETITVASSSSADPILPLQATSSAKEVPVQITAIGQSASDSIKKKVTIHPDGEKHEVLVNDLAGSARPLQFEVPANAITDSVEAQVTFYPSLLSRILGSVRALLTRPYGCAEQTISSTYPNLLFLRALQRTKLDAGDLKSRAEKNLRDGYDRLLNYQGDDGGFSYWGHQDRPDAALTAYAIQFLEEAKGVIPVDPDRLEKARTWLGNNLPENVAVRALQVYSLLRSGSVPDIDTLLGTLARKSAQTSDPYAIAQFALAAMSAGKTELAQSAVAELQKSAKDEQGTVYWDMAINTPFYGWGRSGQIETTALAVSALAQWRETGGKQGAKLDSLIDRAVLFLFRNAGPDGAWPTTQATVRSLDALLSVWNGIEPQAKTTVMISVNNGPGTPVSLGANDAVRGPITVGISRFVHAGAVNQISFSGADDAAIQVQATASWYEPWRHPERARTLEFTAQCGPATLAINEAGTCDVSIGRTSFRGYGMLIANIGLPPGAEVDRGSLTSLVEAGTIDSFEIAPDHVVAYVWPQAADTHFKFGFRPRFAMHAKSAQSMLYDYYNPDEKVVLEPMEFQVH